MVLVDTSVWIDFFADRDLTHVAAAKAEIARDNVVIGDLILVEILQGLKHPRTIAKVEGALVGLTIETLCGPEIAPRAAAYYRLLRQRGITVRGTVDVIIATWCIENRVALLHSDRDFQTMERELGLIPYGA